jgi:hypothetical protein
VAEGTTIAAILTGTAAVITAVAAVTRAKNTGTRECEETLEETRKEAEAKAAEIHRLRMRHPEEIEEEPTKEVKNEDG